MWPELKKKNEAKGLPQVQGLLQLLLVGFTCNVTTVLSLHASCCEIGVQRLHLKTPKKNERNQM